MLPVHNFFRKKDVTGGGPYRKFKRCYGRWLEWERIGNKASGASCARGLKAAAATAGLK